jgi:pimeloyl-ACP methyl ester carboxylesterase
MPTLRREGATIHYIDTGVPDGRPGADTVFFGHGLLFSAWMFHRQIAALRRTYRCVAIDWRGHGDSTASTTGYDMDTLSADAIALIEHLAVAGVHYVGLSMGGFVGLRIGARRPELLRSLALLDTSADAEDAAARYRLMARIYRITGITPLRHTVERLMFGPSFLADPASQPILDEWDRRLRQCSRSAISSAVRAVADRASVEHEIGTIAVPTLVIVGADDVPTPPAKAKQIAERIAGSRLVQLPNCGHSSTLEQPEVVTQLLSVFYSRARI